jgi:hypothetical protein
VAIAAARVRLVDPEAGDQEIVPPNLEPRRTLWEMTTEPPKPRDADGGDVPARMPVLFEVPEYQRAFLTFTRNALRGLSSAKDPILGRMRRQQPTRSYLGRNSMPQRQVHEGVPMPVQSEFILTAAEILDADARVLGRKLNDLTDSYLASLMPQIFEAIGAATVAAGTHLDAGGKPLSADLFIEMIEKMEVQFDDEGRPQLQMVIGPDTTIPTPSNEDQRRIDEVFERKHQEFIAKRRSRKLPPNPLRS